MGSASDAPGVEREWRQRIVGRRDGSAGILRIENGVQAIQSSIIGAPAIGET
jgi:hypothetical protein